MVTTLHTGIILSATGLFSYLVGAIPSGYIIGKMAGVGDIRKHGSGNIGATNVTRVAGKTWGRVCFLCDFIKGALPVMAVILAVSHFQLVKDPYGVMPATAAFCAVCGHIWPIYLGFKGGKGVSTAAGVIVALNPPALGVGGLTWLLVFSASRYVSLASIAAATALPISALIFRKFGIWHASGAELVLLFTLGLLTIIKHKSNIQRLLDGTESRFEKKSDKKD